MISGVRDDPFAITFDVQSAWSGGVETHLLKFVGVPDRIHLVGPVLAIAAAQTFAFVKANIYGNRCSDQIRKIVNNGIADLPELTGSSIEKIIWASISSSVGRLIPLLEPEISRFLKNEFELESCRCTALLFAGGGPGVLIRPGRAIESVGDPEIELLQRGFFQATEAGCAGGSRVLRRIEARQELLPENRSVLTTSVLINVRGHTLFPISHIPKCER